ncbi:unnamed protein product [Mycena citricolor]|uniref:Hemerythrin-like domain-containing protein n=1 Tax=Mycena citricolor TaxID=2018698 RepID=A0AAD2HVU6_9AGAR|nr:unnamed protein product [Mycena citricolor]CAK5265885.1 unnamed protein product [Mycena citricolor]CAK5281117.1 unnamed protein product [Mycena citricolor]
MSPPTKWFETPYALIDLPSRPTTIDDPRAPESIVENVARNMVFVHNFLLRGLNSIYAQAPYVTAPDVPSFLNYIKTWTVALQVHHDGEEDHLFPFIAKETGQGDLMAGNIAGHAAFHEGLDRFVALVAELQQDASKYDGRRIVEVVGAFGGLLRDHLADEIPTLLALAPYGARLAAGLEAEMRRDGIDSMRKCGLTQGVIQIFCLDDNTWENGATRAFPPIPSPVAVVLRRGLYLLHHDWWRFASSDQFGNPRAQPYARPLAN